MVQAQHDIKAFFALTYGTGILKVLAKNCSCSYVNVSGRAFFLARRLRSICVRWRRYRQIVALATGARYLGDVPLAMPGYTSDVLLYALLPSIAYIRAVLLLCSWDHC